MTEIPKKKIHKPKDFQKWHTKKATIDEIIERPFFHEQEIWFCHLDAVFWGVPLTHTHKKNQYYFAFRFRGRKMSVAVLSQLRLIDARRLSYRMGDMDEKEFRSLIKQIKALLP